MRAWQRVVLERCQRGVGTLQTARPEQQRHVVAEGVPQDLGERSRGGRVPAGVVGVGRVGDQWSPGCRVREGARVAVVEGCGDGLEGSPEADVVLQPPGLDEGGQPGRRRCARTGVWSAAGPTARTRGSGTGRRGTPGRGCGRRTARSPSAPLVRTSTVDGAERSDLLVVGGVRRAAERVVTVEHDGGDVDDRVEEGEPGDGHHPAGAGCQTPRPGSLVVDDRGSPRPSPTREAIIRSAAASPTRTPSASLAAVRHLRQRGREVGVEPSPGRGEVLVQHVVCGGRDGGRGCVCARFAGPCGSVVDRERHERQVHRAHGRRGGRHGLGEDRPDRGLLPVDGDGGGQRPSPLAAARAPPNRRPPTPDASPNVRQASHAGRGSSGTTLRRRPGCAAGTAARAGTRAGCRRRPRQQSPSGPREHPT